MYEHVILNPAEVLDALNKALNTAIRKQGYCEDEWFEYMMDEDENGDFHWSETLTKKVLHRMGYGRLTLRGRNRGMDEDSFNRKYAAFFMSCHLQMAEMKLV